MQIVQELDRDAWVADPAISWRILLEADLHDALPVPAAQARLDDVNASLGTVTTAIEEHDDLSALRSRLAAESPAAIAAGISGTRLVVSAHHHHVDGLGLLAVLGELTGMPARSSARGTADRPVAAAALTTYLNRLVEVVFRPPARIATTSRRRRARGGDSADTFAELSVDRPVRPAELVHACVEGVRTFNARSGRSSRRTTIAVGVSQVGGARADIGEHSALLRLRDLDGLSRVEVAERVRQAPVQPAPVPTGTHPLLGLATRLALRLFGGRLGSTLLVSHLGVVRPPAGGYRSLAFHPVTGGGSGVSVGAVELDGVTVLTARGRARQHAPEDLRRLLDDVAEALASAASE